MLARKDKVASRVLAISNMLKPVERKVQVEIRPSQSGKGPGKNMILTNMMPNGDPPDVMLWGAE